MGGLTGKDPSVAQEERPNVPLPPSARAFLLSLRDGAIGTPETLAASAADLLRVPAIYPRARRAMHVAVCAALPAVMALVVLIVVRLKIESEFSDPKKFQFDSAVQRLASYEKRGDALTRAQKDDRDALEVFIAEHLQDELKEATAVARTFPITTRATGELRVADRLSLIHI